MINYIIPVHPYNPAPIINPALRLIQLKIPDQVTLNIMFHLHKKR